MVERLLGFHLYAFLISFIFFLFLISFIFFLFLISFIFFLFLYNLSEFKYDDARILVSNYLVKVWKMPPNNLGVLRFQLLHLFHSFLSFNLNP